MEINYAKNNGLVPAIVQDYITHKVLMLGYMNEEAYEKTIKDEKVTFFSRSKKRLWTKGEESGNFLYMQSIKVDCDGDTLLVRAIPKGPVCHKGTDTCWAEKNEKKEFFIQTLEALIKERKKNPSSDSYTSSLFAKGINKIAQKVGEEAVELIIEAKDNHKELFLNESADLLYHYLILLHAKEVSLDDVIKILKARAKKK